MYRNALFTMFATTLLATWGCEVSTDTELPEEVDLALEAAIDSLDDMRGELPIADDELNSVMRGTVVEALADLECPRHGLLAGFWGSAELGSPIDGYFFELGGDEQGFLEGTWAPLDCGGCPDGGYFGEWESVSGRTGEMEGYYDDNRFEGEWFEVDPESGDPGHPSGEMAGRYHRINELGGYFFGVWSVCSDDDDSGNGVDNGNGNADPDDPDGNDDPHVETDDDEDGDDNAHGNADDNANGNA